MFGKIQLRRIIKNVWRKKGVLATILIRYDNLYKRIEELLHIGTGIVKFFFLKQRLRDLIGQFNL